MTWRGHGLAAQQWIEQQGLVPQTHDGVVAATIPPGHPLRAYVHPGLAGDVADDIAAAFCQDKFVVSLTLRS